MSVGFGFMQPPVHYNGLMWDYQKNTNIAWVQGESGARAYPVMANCTVLLMDSENDVFYIKKADVNGVPAPLQKFSYHAEEASEVSANDTVTRKEFDDIKKMLEDLTAPSNDKKG